MRVRSACVLSLFLGFALPRCGNDNTSAPPLDSGTTGASSDSGNGAVGSGGSAIASDAAGDSAVGSDGSAVASDSGADDSLLADASAGDSNGPDAGSHHDGNAGGNDTLDSGLLDGRSDSARDGSTTDAKPAPLLHARSDLHVHLGRVRMGRGLLRERNLGDAVLHLT